MLRSRSILATLAAIGALICVAVPAQAGLLDGLQAYWSFDDSGDQQADDTSGYNRHAQLGNSGSADSHDPAWVAGKFSSALNFDGLDDEARAGTFDPSSAGKMSVSAWLRWDGTPDPGGSGHQVFLAKRDSWNANEMMFQTLRNSGGWGGMQRNGSTADFGNGLFFDDGAFHHYVITTEPGSNNTRMYVDGDEVSTSPKTFSFGNDVAAAVMIGSQQPGGNETWYGAIDDLAVWDRVLTGEEIGALWNRGGGTPISSIPEPATLLLAGLAVSGLAGYARRRKRR